MTRKRRNWHLEEIKAELRKHYGSLGVLSESWGLCPSAISDTLRRPRNSMRVERRIAAALGAPLHELWPLRWDSNGAPLPRTAARNSAVNAAARQKRAAA